MGNGYDIHHHHHHHHQNQPFIHKNIFLPMFCRLSLKDVKLNNIHYKERISHDEPSSPKVSCMGQVKRNNRVIGFPTSTSSTTSSTTIMTVSSHNHRYTKLKKFFSSKTLLPPSTTNMSTASRSHGSRSCREIMGKSSSRRMKLIKKKHANYHRNGDHDQDCVNKVDIGEMDPPLPVVKRVGVGRDEVNIWKRRFNGTGIKRLEIERVHVMNGNGACQPPPTV